MAEKRENTIMNDTGDTAMEHWTYDTLSLEALMNKSKDVLLKYLCDEGEITPEQRRKISKTSVMLIRDPKIISVLYSKLKGKKSVPQLIVGKIQEIKEEQE